MTEGSSGYAMSSKIEERVKLLEFETLSDNHYKLHRATFNFRHSNGAWQTASRESYNIGRSVAVLPMDLARNLVLLTKQFRWPAFETGYRQLLVEVVAGIVNRESSADCAHRETYEEAGVKLQLLSLFTECFLSPGAVTERMSLYLATYDSTAARLGGGGLFHECEDIEVFEVSLDEALAMIARGEIIDAKTILLIQAAKLRPDLLDASRRQCVSRSSWQPSRALMHVSGAP